MSGIKTTEADNNALVAFLKRNVLAIVLAMGFAGWQIIEPLLGKGAEAEFHAKLIEAYAAPAVRQAAKAEFEANLTDPVILNKVLGTQEVEDFSKEASTKIRNAVIEDVMKKDTNKVSMRAFLGMQTGVRNEDVLPLMAELLNAYKKGELMTKKQVEQKLKGYTKIPQF